MLNDWVYWLTNKHFDELFIFLWAFLLFDATRYLVIKLIVCFYDIFYHWLFGYMKSNYDYCPTVSVLLAGYNEEVGITNTLESIWGSYPRLEIIVVDDGSTDETYQVAQEFARSHSGILVMRRDERGGKASALNYGYLYTKGQIIVVIDTDSTLEKNAIWELVQPFKDQDVGAVSGNILARNNFRNFITWFQSYEYLNSIFIGRICSARLGILGIVSGAHGAFLRQVWDRCMGMDVGPPEDLDITLRIRKAGYKIAFAPHALCYTDVPETWTGLVNQRFRWEQGGVVRNHCRKHIDMVDIFSPNFRWGNCFLWLETFYFDLVSPFLIFGYFIWLVCKVQPGELFYILAWLYTVYLIFEVLQLIVCFFYSRDLKRDFITCSIFPLMIIYRTVLLVVRVIAICQEIFFRVSFKDNYVPEKVRQSTWKW